jgi:hypothetical protein
VNERAVPGAPPGVVVVYILYCCAWTVAGPLLVTALLLGPRLEQARAESAPSPDLMLLGWALAAVGLLLSLLHAGALWAALRRRGWALHLFLIALGLTICTPLMVPVLLFWLKPATRAHFENG